MSEFPADISASLGWLDACVESPCEGESPAWNGVEEPNEGLRRLCEPRRSARCGTMITLLRAKERSHLRHRKQEVWRTFQPQDWASPLTDGFGALEMLNEERVSPGAGLSRQPRRETEVVTYVREGALAYEDSTSHSGIIQAGEFQRMTASRSVRHSETNASRIDWAHVFQIWLRPSEFGQRPQREQKRFTVANRRGGLCLVASPDARQGSLLLHRDVLIFSTLLSPGEHLAHPLPATRCAWLHVVQGEITLGDVVLAEGDGAGMTEERAVSLTARDESELLLIDLGEALSPRR
jgi:quercetin 2,3-dioxygenase